MKKFLSTAARYLKLSPLFAITGFIGFHLCKFEQEGVASLYSEQIAFYFPIVLMLLLAVFAHWAAAFEGKSKPSEKRWRRKCRAITWALVILTSLQFGLAFNENLKHEGSKRAAGIVAGAKTTAVDETLLAAQADLETIQQKVITATAEIGGLESLVTKVVEIDREMDRNELAIIEIQNDGKRETAMDVAKIAQAKEANVKLAAQRAAMTQPGAQEIASKKSALAALQDQESKAAAAVAAIRGELQQVRTESATLDSGQHFIFNFAQRAAQNDSDIASAMVVGFGFVLGFIAQGAFAVLCTFGVARHDEDLTTNVRVVISDDVKKNSSPMLVDAKMNDGTDGNILLFPTGGQPDPEAEERERAVKEIESLKHDRLRSEFRALNKLGKFGRVYSEQAITAMGHGGRKELMLSLVRNSAASEVAETVIAEKKASKASKANKEFALTA